MASQTVLARKKRGPAPTGKGQQVVVRFHDPLLSALEAFAADQGDPSPSRPEAVRRALAEHLRAKGYLAALSDGPG